MTSSRIELLGDDHAFAQNPRLSISLNHFFGRAGRKLADDALELFIEKASDEFRCVGNGLAVIVQNGDDISVAYTLRDHQAVDTIRGEIFHIAVEQAGSAAVEHAVAIANHGANRGARSGKSSLADALWRGA